MSRQLGKLWTSQTISTSQSTQRPREFREHPLKVSQSYRSQLPTGLIALGFATDSSSLSTAIGDSIEKRSNSILIKVASTQCLNLKSALKHIIRLGINHGEEAAQDGELILRDDQVCYSSQQCKLFVNCCRDTGYSTTTYNFSMTM